MSKTIQLGERYRDSLTGYEGVATARHEYLYGCVRIALERIGDNGEVKTEVFDEQRLATVADDQPVKQTATSGGPRTEPTTRRPGE
jgi:hypothetical protein